MSCFILFSQLVLGQQKPNGTYIRNERTLNGISSEEIITIKDDSIWFSKKRIGRNIFPELQFENWVGEVVYYKNILVNGENDGPHFAAILMVMSCDTCPQFWKYTQKTVDSLDIKENSWVNGKTDTVIKNGDTTFIIPEIIIQSYPVDFNRIREIIFKISKQGDLILNSKFYKRQKGKLK